MVPRTFAMTSGASQNDIATLICLFLPIVGFGIWNSIFCESCHCCAVSAVYIELELLPVMTGDLYSQ